MGLLILLFSHQASFLLCVKTDKGVYLGFKYPFSLLPLEQGFEAFDEFGLSVFGQPPCCC